MHSSGGRPSGGPRFLRFGGSDMKTTTSIKKTETTHGVAANFDGRGDTNNLQAPEVQAKAAARRSLSGLPLPFPDAAARRQGLTVKEVAALMGVNYGHLCAVANGHRPWTPMLREKGHGGPGRGTGPGSSLPPGRAGPGREHRHSGAGPCPGTEPEGAGRPGRRVRHLHVPGGPGAAGA